MLNINGEKIFTQTELLENLTTYIEDSVGENDWEDHVYMMSGYVAAMIGNDEHYVRGYLRRALKLQR